MNQQIEIKFPNGMVAHWTHSNMSKYGTVDHFLNIGDVSVAYYKEYQSGKRRVFRNVPFFEQVLEASTPLEAQQACATIAQRHYDSLTTLPASM